MAYAQQISSSPIANFFNAIGNFFINAHVTAARLERVEHLQSMTDEQLEKRGLKREDIAHHVFRDLFYI